MVVKAMPSPQNPLNSGLGIIVICPDIVYNDPRAYNFFSTLLNFPYSFTCAK